MSYTLTFIVLLISLMASGVQAGQIEPAQLSATVKVLASEEFAGRAPGGPGEEKTVTYLVERFVALGLEPGGENGGWRQSVPLIHTKFLEPISLSFGFGESRQPLVQGNDIAVSTVRPVEQIRIDEASRREESDGLRR